MTDAWWRGELGALEVRESLDALRAALVSGLDGGGDPAALLDAVAERDPLGGPGEEEEADGGTKGAGEGGDETVLLVGHAVFHHAGIGVVVEVGRVDGHGEDARYQDTQEDETDLAQVHAVVHRVDEGENFED